ncbi:MAG TPA: hypothetical protein VH230_14205 [Stellaceae bacterium]|nr:hypothetical protein [Stellaceae bacterium]
MSVTQQFNTTTSIGRLTLNVLLSVWLISPPTLLAPSSKAANRRALTFAKLAADADLPLAWPEQRKALGFD